MTSDSLTLRLMTDADLPMLQGWLNSPHVLEWWREEEHPPSLPFVIANYRPSDMTAQQVIPYILMLGQAPIGYAQSYTALGSGDGWWEGETDLGVRGIDQFIATPELLNRGVGTQLVRALVEHLFANPEVTKIQVDPDPSNLRAIRCYEKAGFTQQKLITTPDGLAVYMVQTREQFLMPS